jgi:hypothetical protein
MSKYDIAVVLVVAFVIVALLVVLLIFVAQGGLNMMSLLQGVPGAA